MRYSLRKQLGFIYLTTGANGAGKTLLTLKDVREKQVKEGRSVYFNGFDINEAKMQEFGWQKCDPTKWQDLPDGAIVIMDECQDQFPVRPNGSKVPDYVEKLAVHRKRGFDFFMITQHPSNIDKFVVKLIGDPGYHRHLKRTFGAELVSVLRWSAVNLQCEKPSSGKTGQVTSVPYPKEVYSWYKSSTLHTAKRTIPKQVFVLAGALVLIPLLGYFAVQQLPGFRQQDKDKIDATQQVQDATRTAMQAGPIDPAGAVIQDYAPALPGFPHTAPRYAGVTQPVVAPYPAACVKTADDCTCYTQQATRMPMDREICAQVVANGFFIDWEQRSIEQQDQKAQQGQQQAPQDAQTSAGTPTPPAFPQAAPVLEKPRPLSQDRPVVFNGGTSHDGQVLAEMRKRSAS